MTQQQLWKASRASGLSNLTSDEFCGSVLTVGNSTGESEPRGPFELVLILQLLALLAMAFLLLLRLARS